MADVRVNAADDSRANLLPFEADPARLLEGPLQDGGPFLLSELPFRLLRNRPRSRAIRDRFITHVNTAVAKEGWYDRRGRRVLSRLRLLTFSGTLAAFPLGFLIDGRRGGTGLLLGAIACWLVLLAGGISPRLTTRRTAQAATAADRWRTFKR